MTEQRLQSVEAPRGRGLAPLSDGLGPQERVFAEHLRDLRQRTGMTSADLATELGVDATRLSRYLSGHNLPDPQLLTRLHRLLASSHEDAAEVPARQSRALLYAAARARGPLSARAFEVAELQEKLQEQQAATEHALAGLREELKRERGHRRRAEEEIERLRRTGPGDHDKRIRELERERDAALRRVAELEDAVAQTDALSRLQRDDAEHVHAMAEATQDALARWEHGESPAPQTPQEDTLWLSGKTEVKGKDVVESLARLRDEGRDGEADEIIQYAAVSASAAAVGSLYRVLKENGRQRDADRLVRAIARHCPAVRLRQLVVEIKLPAKRIVLPDAEGRRRGAGLLDWQEEDTEEAFAAVLLPAVAWSTPIDVLTQLVRSFRERGEDDFLRCLRERASSRSRAERRQLREAGLGVFHRWLG